MRTLVFILSAATILLFTTCEEDGPTTIGPNESNPYIASISKSGENNTTISNYSSHLSNLECISDSEVFYVTDKELIIQSIFNPTEKFVVNIEGGFEVVAKVYDEGSLIIFSNNGDIYKVENRTNFIVNITNTADTSEMFPIYLKKDTSLVYMMMYNLNNKNIAALIKHNLNSGLKDLLYEGHSTFPLYTTYDGEKLIFFESNSYDLERGYFKSLLFSDPENINLLGSADLKGALSSSISNDNKIIHTSNGKTILFNINTLTEKIVRGIYPNHSYISNDGKSIISAQDVGLCLYDGEGLSSIILLENIKDKRYFHKVAFSPSSNTIVYVQSKSPEYY